MTLDGNHFQKWYLWNQEVILQQWAETSWVLAGGVRGESGGEPGGGVGVRLGEKVVLLSPRIPLFLPFLSPDGGELLFLSSRTDGTSLTTLACPRW